MLKESPLIDLISFYSWRSCLLMHSEGNNFQSKLLEQEQPIFVSAKYLLKYLIALKALLFTAPNLTSVHRDSWTGRIHLTRMSFCSPAFDTSVLKWTREKNSVLLHRLPRFSLSHSHKIELERSHFVPPPLYQSVSIQQFDLLFKTGLSPPLVFIHFLSPFSFLLLPLSPFPGATHMTRVIAIIC